MRFESVSERSTAVFNNAGREVARIYDVRSEPGAYRIVWRGDEDEGRDEGVFNSWQSALDFCRMWTGEYAEVSS